MPPQSFVLDRVLVSNAWENHFNLVTALAFTKIGSDHNPIVVDTGGSTGTVPLEKRFKFDAQEGWLQKK
jgi:hypothetical protein